MVLALIIAFQLAVAAFSIEVLSGVRAYIAGESLYSKGQKDALLHLEDFFRSRSETDFARYRDAIRAPLGDRMARESLQRQPPDVEAARAGFTQGGNSPDDIDSLIRLFVWGHSVPFMADAIATWTEGDNAIAELTVLADRAHELVQSGDRGFHTLAAARSEVVRLNGRLSALEHEFSGKLGVAARKTKVILIGLNLLVAAGLGGAGLFFVRTGFRVYRLKERQIRDGRRALRRILDSSEEGIYGVDEEGLITFVNKSAIRMLGHDDETQLLGTPVTPTVHDAFDRNVPQCRSGPILRRRDGSYLAVDYWSHPAAGDEGLTPMGANTPPRLPMRFSLTADSGGGALRWPSRTAFRSMLAEWRTCGTCPNV